MTKANGADTETNKLICNVVKYDINKDVLIVNSKRQSRVLSAATTAGDKGKVLHGIFESSYRC